MKVVRVLLLTSMKPRIYLQKLHKLWGAKSRFPSGSWSTHNVGTVKLTQQTSVENKEVNEKAGNKLGVTFTCHLLAGWSVSQSQGRTAVQKAV